LCKIFCVKCLILYDDIRTVGLYNNGLLISVRRLSVVIHLVLQFLLHFVLQMSEVNLNFPFKSLTDIENEVSNLSSQIFIIKLNVCV